MARTWVRNPRLLLSVTALAIVLASALLFVVLHEKASEVAEPMAAVPTLEPLSSATPVPGVAGTRAKSSPMPTPVHKYVGPQGSDDARRGSKAAPWKTISFALSQAAPGTTIVVAPGQYAEHIVTARNASVDKPITLEAQGKVVLTGAGDSGRIIEVLHDYHVIKGFEFKDRDILLWLQEADYTLITGNFFHHAQGECVRLKYHSTNNIFEKNKVEDCGLEDFTGEGDGKNGEGIYIGTAPEQLDRNPTPEADHSNANIVRANTFNTKGNECVDIKEGSEKNVVEYNTCTGQKDTESAGLDSRGNRNTFRYNKVYGNLGAGIRFGGDTDQEGLYNEAYGNEIYSNAREAVKVLRGQQGTICGNSVRDNKKGFSNKKYILNPDCPFPLN